MSDYLDVPDLDNYIVPVANGDNAGILGCFTWPNIIAFKYNFVNYANIDKVNTCHCLKSIILTKLI